MSKYDQKAATRFRDTGAKAQLAILQNEDSQPLRRARLTAQAAARKAKKTTKVFAAAAKQAADAKAGADDAAAAAAAKVDICVMTSSLM